MRHGKPTFDLEKIKYQRMPATRLREIVGIYETSDLDFSCSPDANSIKIAQECSLSISSDLPRGISSCELLGLGNVNTIDPCFRESAPPFLEFSWPRLTFFSWAVVFRVAWLFGFSKNGESFKDAKLRSRLCADKLEILSRETGAVLHVGHGIMNRLLIKELKRRKWLVKDHTGEKYWSYTIMECET